VSLVTDVPEALRFHGIEPPKYVGGFEITLDEAEPQGGGRVVGRVERRDRRPDQRPVLVDVSCQACWMDIAPQFVGRKGLLHWSAYGDMRNRTVPVWLDEQLFRTRLEVGALEEVNWRYFSIDFPDGLPRALEGTFGAFRWRIEARRKRRIGAELASLPLLLDERQILPVVRVETTPIGTWRLLAWKSEHDVDASGGPCSIHYEQRRSSDLPLPGETPETEFARRASS
jgi:hypothetical protein